MTTPDWSADVKRFTPSPDAKAIAGIVRRVREEMDESESAAEALSQDELADVRENFLKKALGLKLANAKLDEAIAEVRQRIEEKARDRAAERIGDEVRGKARERIGEEARGKARERIGEEARGKARERIGEEARGKARERIGEEAREGARQRMGNEIRESAAERRESAEERMRRRVALYYLLAERFGKLSVLE
jgi:hypothetical protein